MNRAAGQFGPEERVAPRRCFGVSLWAAAAGLLAALALVAGGPAGAQTSGNGVAGFGGATFYGSPMGSTLDAPIAGMASTPDGRGYWLVGADGGVFTYGDARFYGSEANSGLATPVTGIAPTPDGLGYWIVGIDGNVYNFGDAQAPGPIGAAPAAPTVGIAGSSTGGFWLVGADGGVFTDNGAGFFGSMGGAPLVAPMVGMAGTPDGKGYWLVASDGGVFSFGDAGFFGSMGGKPLNAPIVGMAPTPDGGGYWLVAADGGVFSFGDAQYEGSQGADPPPGNTPVVAMAAAPTGGYWLATTARALPPATPVPSVVYDCNQPNPASAVEPSSIILACADANALLTGLTWSSWTATTAVASGVYTHNTCEPDCAAGVFVSEPASVSLGYPLETSGGREFAMISYTVPSSAPGGRTTYMTVASTSPG